MTRSLAVVDLGGLRPPLQHSFGIFAVSCQVLALVPEG